MTYVPQVYRTSGGDELVVDTSGNLAIHESGTITLAAGALIYTAATTAVALFTTGGNLGDYRIPVEYYSCATNATLTNYGYSYITALTTPTTQTIYDITPALGRVKWITCGYSTTTGYLMVRTTGTFDGTNPTIKFSTGGSNPQTVLLVGASTDRWYYCPLTTDMALANS